MSAAMGSENTPSVEDLVVALRSLPVRTDRHVPFGLHAALISLSLAICKEPSLAQALRPATKKQLIAQLRRLGKALAQLDRALSELSVPATTLLDRARRKLSLQWEVSIPQMIRLWLDEHYPGLARAAASAAEELESDQPQADRGRRADQNIKTLMQVLADTFFAVTGRAPARHVDAYEDGREIGAFVPFVTKIFELAGIDRSAEHEARWAIDDYKERHKTE